MICIHQAHSMEREFLGTPQNRGKLHFFVGNSLEINVRGRMCLMSSHKKNINVVSICIMKVFCINIRPFKHHRWSLWWNRQKKPPNFYLWIPPIWGPPNHEKILCKTQPEIEKKIFFVVFNFFNKKNLQKS